MIFLLLAAQQVAAVMAGVAAVVTGQMLIEEDGQDVLEESGTAVAEEA